MSRLYVVSGPSGVGKSTVVAEVLKVRPDIWLSVSATTRPPRPGEQSGREYFFVSAEEFAQRADAELAAVAEFDHVVRNIDVATAAEELSALIV